MVARNIKPNRYACIFNNVICFCPSSAGIAHTAGFFNQTFLLQLIDVLRDSRQTELQRRNNILLRHASASVQKPINIRTILLLDLDKSCPTSTQVVWASNFVGYDPVTTTNKVFWANWVVTALSVIIMVAIYF